MATLDQRVADIEYLVAHLPEDLGARFAGIHTKMAELREAAAIQTHRLGIMDARLSRVEKSIQDIVKLLDERLPKA